MNLSEAWRHNLVIHHRQGIMMALYPEQGVADVTVKMAIEVCPDYEAGKYLPMIAKRLCIPQSALYVERGEFDFIWVAIDKTLPRLSASDAAHIAAFLRVPIDDGWFPGPLPPPVEQPGAFWQEAYGSLRQEEERLHWSLEQIAHQASMELRHPQYVGGPVDWYFEIRKAHKRLGDYSVNDAPTINAALQQAGIPLNGWFSAREAKRQKGFAVMKRAGII